MKKLFILLILCSQLLIAIQLETERLILRSWKAGDIRKLYKILQDPNVNQYLHGLGDTYQSVEKFVLNAEQLIIEKNYGYLACEEKQSGDLIGFAGLNYIDILKNPFPYFTISFAFAQKHWGKGYATQAGYALLKFAFEQHDLQLVGACAAVTNIASITTMKRLGMSYKCTFDFPGIPKENIFCENVFYAISREAFYD